jgi:rhamnogalacturonyl hydrolase YesR
MDHDYLSIVSTVLQAAQKEQYSGYSKFDALNSPVLQKLSLDNKWMRILFTQLVKECPINLRPLFRVRKSRNPKGIALFVRAYLFLYLATNKKDFLDEAENLVTWLLENHSNDSEFLSWGYNFVWQSPLFLQDVNEPNTVVTVFVGEALVHAFEITGKQRYLDAAVSVTLFLTRELPILYDSPTECAFAYVRRDVKAIVLNNQMMIGALLAKVAQYKGDAQLLETATKCVRFTVNKKTPYHCWYYTYPSEKSHIRHDNYHTGGILDGLLEYSEYSGNDEFLDTYWSGLEYYRLNLFGPRGEPYWMNDRKYPYDVHGSAQGIISFTKASRINPDYLQPLISAASWAVSHLYRPDSRNFIYRKGKYYTWNYSLMRWCNGWMTRALAELVATHSTPTN